MSQPKKLVLSFIKSEFDFCDVSTVNKSHSILGMTLNGRIVIKWNSKIIFKIHSLYSYILQVE